ncbi:MAG: co-chaperone GroES [Gemmatimonadota bacterium]
MATASKSKVTIKPLADRVVVQPIEETEEMHGSLYIPDTAKEKPQQGRVVAVGPGRTTDEGERVPVELDDGDRVLYRKYSGTEVTVNAEEYLIIRESDVLAVLED